MGVKNLWDILESCKQTLPLHHLQNKRVCVDLSCWLVQLKNACKSPVGVKDKLYLRNLFHRIRALIALNCSLIFVTDGSIPSIKLSTYRRRLGLNSEAREEGSLQAVASLRRNKGSEFSCMIKEAKVLCRALGIPCLDGLEEAEAQCALLNSAFICDGCFSSDSDIFLFGARTVYRDIFLDEGGYVICYEMADIERTLGFGRNSLISLALLLGGDYSNRVHGFGPDTACKIVKSIGDDKILQHIISDGLTMKKKVKKKTINFLTCDMNKENKTCVNKDVDGVKSLGPDKQIFEVINAYLKPKCHSVESDDVMRVCMEHPFRRTEFQQICEQFFGWSPDKTDEYILPKITERDLRRFANLRATSSKLGEKIPLHKMPVTCPVSAILKERKVHRKEYFEVSWGKVDEMRTSIVPADLVERACPEKIEEYMRKKAESKGKKQTTRQKKSSKAVVTKVNVQLQGLALTGESQNSIPTDASGCDQHVPAAVARSEVIDLCSPSPPLNAGKVTKFIINTDHNDGINVAGDTVCRTDGWQNVDVIEICESDCDLSVEHQKKARELRSFIDSIRRELLVD